MSSRSGYDAIVVGAGHNGLVTAAYLARAGRRVLVLERRDLVGGACVTEELWPGYKVSTAAYVNSLFRPEIVRDLDLARHGFAMIGRSPSSFTPLPDGRHLLLGPDPGLNRSEISKFSTRDADAYPRYEEVVDRVARIVEPFLLETPPDVWSLRPANVARLGKLFWKILGLRRDGPALWEFLTGAARAILDRWFETDALKATLATDAVIGAVASPSMPGTAYVLLHHVMGECEGKRGVWGYVRGGMGALSKAIEAAARRHGAEIRVGAEVARIRVRGGEVRGVVLASGEEIDAPQVASGIDARTTFLRLVGPAELPGDFVADVRKIDYSSASMKVHLALAELPSFLALPGSAPGPQHRGTIHISPTMDHLEQAYDDAKYGRPSATPVLECTIASALDPTIAPEGRHILSMFVQYAPYALRQGSWDEVKDSFADRCIDLLAEYAPNVPGAILHRHVLSPLDIERTYGLTGGNIFQGAMTLGQLFSLRPLPGYADYRTPIRGLYLCGAATHPGGGVIGACGYNAAREILHDRRR